MPPRLPAPGALLACLLLFCPALVRADITLTQRVEGAGGVGDMTVRMQGDHVRADLSQPISMLLDLNTGDAIFLQHHAKTFSRLSAAENAEMAKRFKDAMPPGVGKLMATGQKRLVDGYPTELFIWNMGAMSLRFWIARDIPNAKSLEDRLDRLQACGPFASAAVLMPPPGSLPGLRLRTEMEVGPQKITYTISGVNQDPLDQKLFAVPADYQETPFSLETMPTP